jgi:hypothetical protein
MIFSQHGNYIFLKKLSSTSSGIYPENIQNAEQKI